jgi:hypothetical protein
MLSCRERIAESLAMPKIGIPSDLGTELSEAARWYAGEAETEAFLAHIRADHAWSERRPRLLLAWAEQHAVPVFGVRRFLTVLLAGFAGPDRWRLWQAAKAELRRARDAIARGEESGLAYAGAGRGLLSFSETGPRRWGATETVLQPTLHASLVPETTGATPSASPGSTGGPQLPRGGWITR